MPLFDHGEWPGLNDIDRNYVVRDDNVERVVFNNGAVRDVEDNKPRYTLIPPPILKRLAEVYTKGAEKYSDHNYLKGMPTTRFMDSLMRHVEAYRDGDRTEDHMAMAAWNAFGVMLFEDTKWDNTMEWQDIYFEGCYGEGD